MGTSSKEGKEWACTVLAGIPDIKTVLDVGPGRGTYYDLLEPFFQGSFWIGVEVFEPYIVEHNLKAKYDLIAHADIRKFTLLKGLDLVIFGDVLEHMTREQAEFLYHRFLPHTKYIFISIPVVPYEQDAINGNPFEKHIETDWTHTKVCESFPGIVAFSLGKKIGCYLAEGGA